MARIRSIKPEFWTSEQVIACSMPARLLFIGLWNFCDDMGRLPFKPLQIKCQVFPGDPIEVDAVRGMLQELSQSGLIEVYTVPGEGDFIEITGWHHQRIDKPQPAKFPAKPGHSTTIPGTLQECSSTDRIKEGIKEGIGVDNKDASRYGFQGQIIKLTVADYQSWMKTYPHLEFPSILMERDGWLQEQPLETQKKWPFSTHPWLSRRNADAKAKVKPGLRPPPQFKTAIEDKPRESQEQREAALSKWEQRRRELADAVVRCNDEGEKRKPRQPKPPKARVRHLLPTSPAMDHAEEDEAEAGRKALPN